MGASAFRLRAACRSAWRTAGRRDAQQPAEQRQPADAVSGRAAGVQRGDERLERAERRALGRVGERGHPIRDQQPARQRFRVPPRPALQRNRPVRANRSRRQAGGRWPEQAPVRGTLGGPIVRDRLFFFGGLPGYAAAPAALGEHRLRTDGRDAGGRFHRLRLAGVPGASGRPGGALCQQHGQPGALQFRCAESRQAAAADDRSLRADYVYDVRRPGRRAGSRANRLSAEREPFAVRPVHAHCPRETGAIRAGSGQRAHDGHAGTRQPGAVGCRGQHRRLRQ